MAAPPPPPPGSSPGRAAAHAAPAAAAASQPPPLLPKAANGAGVAAGPPPELAAAAPGGGLAADVAAAIFGCTNSTYDECCRSRWSAPRKYLPLVESIYSAKTLIFLFNFTDRQLHGVYLATSDGRENISLSAWKGSAPTPRTGRKDEATGLEVEDAPGDDEGSPFPAQCTFQLVEEFAPTPEAEFKHVLEYTERQRFKFKLSKWQCRDLVEAMCRHDAKLRAKRLSDELSLGRP